MSIASTTPFSGTQSGTIQSSRLGAENFSRTISNQGGTRTCDTVITLANGKTITRDATFTRTADGWTRNVSTVGANGKATDLQTTGTAQSGGGTLVTGSFTGADGQVQTVTGSAIRQQGTLISDLSFTNAAGQTRIADRQSSVSGNVMTCSDQGTSFGGTAFSSTSALTILQSQEAS